MSLPLGIFDQKKINLIEDQSTLNKILSKDLNQICKDHLQLNNNIILIYFNNDYNDNILIIVKKKSKKFFIPVLEVIYCSDYEKFKKNRRNINLKLLQEFKTPFFMENFF